MPLSTNTPITVSTTQSKQFDQVVIESVTINRLFTREPDELFEMNIERFWLLEGKIVDARVVPIPASVLAAEMAKPEAQAMYSTMREFYYNLLKQVENTPSELQLTD